MNRRQITNILGAKGGGKSGGGGGSSFVEQPNTLQSKDTARLGDLLCAGEIVGLVDGAKSIYLDETQLQNANGTYNFEGLQWDFRTGASEQDYMPGFPQVESETSVGVEVKYGQPVVRTISDQELDAVRVTVNLPALYEQDTNEAEMRKARVAYAFEVSTDGGPYVRKVSVNMTEKCTSPYRISHRINLPSGSSWDIRMVRLIADSTKSTLVNKTEWTSYTRIIDAKMVYPDSAYIGLAVDAALFGSSVPQRAYEIYGRIIKIPSNYDPVTRIYSGLWDGTFKVAYSNNPAWVIYDVLTDPVNGLGRELTPERIDIWSLYSIARYCDELVPDGKSGREPRFTFNGLINTQEDALNSLAALAGACRCIIYFSAGMVYFAQDRPTAMKRILAPANVIDGLFNYEGTALKARHTVVNMSWLDPSDGYKTAVMSVEDAQQIRDLGWRPTDEIAFGCTSAGQAWRQGKFLLETEKRCTETVSFSTGLDCADLMPGDVVGILDPSYAGARAGGRILSITKQEAVLDAPFSFVSSESYVLCVSMPDGSLQDIPIVNTGMKTSRVSFEEPITSLPRNNAIYGILASNLQPRKFRILGIEEAEGIQFNFTGLLYDESIYPYVEENIVLPQPPTSYLPTGPLPAPHSLTWNEYMYLKTGMTALAGCTLSWSYSDPRAMSFEVEWMEPNASGFIGRIYVGAPSVDLDLASQGAYTYRVRAVDGIGRTSPWASLSVTAFGLSSHPANVENFMGVVNGEFLTLSWDQGPDLHLDHYELRYSSSSEPSWDMAQIVDSAISKTQTSIMVPAQQGTYFIRAVSIKGVQSPNPTALYNGVSADFSLLNIVETLPQQTAWSGAKTGVVDSNGILVLEIDESGSYIAQGVYYFDPATLDLTAIYDSRVIPQLVYSGTSLTADVYGVEDVCALPDAYDVEQNNNYRVTLEYSVTDEDPEAPQGLDIYASPDVYAEGDTYAQYQVGWTDWSALQGPLTIRARGYRFRLILESLDGLVSPAVGVCEVTIDMPDRVISQEDYPVPASAEGTYFSFNPPFKKTPAIPAPSWAGMLTTDAYRIDEKSRSGFRLFLYDVETNEPIARTVDWIAKGYGAERILTTGD